MDIAPPPLNLLSTLKGIPSLQDEDPVLRPTRAALLQWARAFKHVTKRRQTEVFKFTAPLSGYLLDIPESFSSKEVVKNSFRKSLLNAIMF